MTVDITSMDHRQLDELVESAKQHKLRNAKEHLGNVRAKIHALLESEGLALTDVFVDWRKTLPPAGAMYRNPADHTQTWSGRGRRPKWFHAALKAGRKEREL